MKKRILTILSVITITLAGCANTETVELHTQPSVETTEETQSIIEEEETMTESEILSTEDTTEVSSVEDEEVVVVNGFELVKEATVDLDGDGVEEEVSFRGEELFVNDVVLPAHVYALEGAKGMFALIDCDVTDSYVEILVPCSWTDSYLVFIRYNAGDIIHMGDLHDYISNEKLLIKGDGIIHGRTRMDVHQTSYVYATFTINEENRLEQTGWEENYIYADYGKKYQLLENLTVFAEKNRNSEKMIMAPQDVTFRRTDGEEWVEVVADDGTIGWMQVGSSYEIIDCDNKDVMEVFKGTGYAN